MKKTNSLHIYSFRLIPLIFLIFFIFGCSSDNISINNLTTEYTTTPLGIDVESPRFAWQMQSHGNQRGIYQTAY